MDRPREIAPGAWFERSAPLWPALVVGLLFAGVLVGRSELYYDDHFRFSTPIAAMFAEAVRSGHLPLWNPWILTGTPLIAERGSMLVHPGTFLALVLEPSHAVGVCVVLLLAMLAAGTTALLRAFDVRPALAAAVGAAVALSGPALSYTSNAPFLATLAAWPLVLLSAVRLARGQGSAWMGGLWLGLAILGGDLPGALLAAVVALVVFVAVGGQLRTQWPRLLLVLGVGLVVGAGSWYPVLWALPFSERGAGIAASEAGRWSFHPAELLGFVWPHPLGLPLPRFTLWPFRWVGERLFLHSVYVGALLAGASLFAFRGGDRVARTLVATALVLLLIATGATTPLWWVLRPLFTFLRYPSKLAAPAALLLALAGAVVIERRLLRPRDLGRLALVIGAVATVGAIAGVAVLRGLARRAGAPDEVVDAAASALRWGCGRVAALAAVAATLAWLRELGRLSAPRMVTLLSAVIFFDVFTTTADLLWTRPPASQPCPDYVPQLGPRGARVMRLGEVDRARLALTERAFSEEQLRHAALLRPMSNVLCHAAVLEPYGLYVGEVAQTMSSLADAYPVALAELSASDLVLAAPGSRAPWLADAMASRRLLPVASSPAGAVALRPTHALPRSFLAGAVALAAHDGIVERLARGSTHVWVAQEHGLRGGRLVTLPRSPVPESLLAGVAPTLEPISPSSWRPGFASYRVASESAKLLVEMDAFTPGWRAYVDGQEATIVQADGFGRAAVVPPGEHTVEWRFFPPLVVASLWVSWISLALVAGLVGWLRWRCPCAERGRRTSTARCRA